MANRIMLNETSYHGAGAIQEIAAEAKARAFKKAFVCSDPDQIYFVFAMDHADCCSVDRMDLDLRSEYGSCKYGNEISASPRITVD